MWFVSKGRFEDARWQISALEAEKQRLQSEVDRLNSFIAWKSTGVPTHPEIDPRPEWMKPGTSAVSEPSKTDDFEPTTLREQAIKATGSRNPRVIAEWISRHNENNYRSTIFAVPNKDTVPTKAPLIATKQEKQDIAQASKDLETALGSDRLA